MPAMILEPVIMECNQYNGFQTFLNVCDFQYRRTILKSLKRGLNQTFILIADIWNYEMHARLV